MKLEIWIIKQKKRKGDVKTLVCLIVRNESDPGKRWFHSAMIKAVGLIPYRTVLLNITYQNGKEMIKRLRVLKKKFDLTAMAITYAEAGEWKTSEDYLGKISELNKSRKPKMVVVALDSDFTDGTIDYSVNLADRMNYDVLAMNIRQPESDGLLTTKSREVFSSLIEKAHESNIHCEMLLAAEDIRTLIRKILKILKHVELVLIQENKGRKISLNLDIPVYKIVSENA